MRVLVAGASGAVGRPLVRVLVAAGHQVIGMMRSPEKAALVRSLGAEHIAADALDAAAVTAAVGSAAPDVIVHELTAIPRKLNPRHFERDFAATNLLRTKGTDNLVNAARAAGVRRVLAQSFGGWPYARDGTRLKKEDDPFDPDPAREFRTTLDSIRYLEQRVTGTPGIDGITLRYGFFYGPVEAGGVGSMLEDVRRRRLPIVGNGGGIWSFIHVEDAAAATLAAIERGEPGAYNIVDDEPAPVSEWLPELARILGAKPPRRVPAWLARLAIGQSGVVMMTEIRGASNDKARRVLGWKPVRSTWRRGFAEEFGRGPRDVAT